MSRNRQPKYTTRRSSTARLKTSDSDVPELWLRHLHSYCDEVDVKDLEGAPPSEAAKQPVDKEKSRDEIRRLSKSALYLTTVPDRSMRVMIDLLEDTLPVDTTISVTLMVGGNMMSGELISTATYWKLFAERWRTYLSGAGIDVAATDEMAQVIAALGTLSDSDKALERKRYEDTGVPTLYPWVSLKNARLFSGSVAIPEEGTLMRIRTSAIDGFTSGALSKSRT